MSPSGLRSVKERVGNTEGNYYSHTRRLQAAFYILTCTFDFFLLW